MSKTVKYYQSKTFALKVLKKIKSSKEIDVIHSSKLLPPILDIRYKVPKEIPEDMIPTKYTKTVWFIRNKTIFRVIGVIPKRNKRVYEFYNTGAIQVGGALQNINDHYYPSKQNVACLGNIPKHLRKEMGQTVYNQARCYWRDRIRYCYGDVQYSKSKRTMSDSWLNFSNFIADVAEMKGINDKINRTDQFIFQKDNGASIYSKETVSIVPTDKRGKGNTLIIPWVAYDAFNGKYREFKTDITMCQYFGVSHEDFVGGKITGSMLPTYLYHIEKSKEAIYSDDITVDWTPMTTREIKEHIGVKAFKFRFGMASKLMNTAEKERRSNMSFWDRIFKFK